MAGIGAPPPPLPGSGPRLLLRLSPTVGAPAGPLCAQGGRHRASRKREGGRETGQPASLPPSLPPRPRSSVSLPPRAPLPAGGTGLRKAKPRRQSYLCRLLRNTGRGPRASLLPAYTSWDSPFRHDTRLISRKSLCTGVKEGALMTTCHRLRLRKPPPWWNK
ncbi:uncharacterized protein LOC140701759 [Pogona vitticeps]